MSGACLVPTATAPRPPTGPGLEDLLHLAGGPEPTGVSYGLWRNFELDLPKEGSPVFNEPEGS